MTQNTTFALDGEFIALNDLLKLAGVCESGGAGKALVAASFGAPSGALTSLATSGIGAILLDVKGKASHAGAAPQLGRNALIELIQYSPTTPDVYAEPVLIVPAWIMKYYILDLSPKNSLVRWLVDQGHTVFILSWRNPDESLAGLTWDDYIEDAPIKAIEVVQDITGQDSLNMLGFCVGGTILTNALAVLAAPPGRFAE